MEKVLVKAGLYAFLVSLALYIIFTRDAVITYTSSSVYTTTYLTVRQYVFAVLRPSLVISLLMVLIVYIINSIHRKSFKW